LVIGRWKINCLSQSQSSRPYVETKRKQPAESIRDVFHTYKYVISGVPVDVDLEELKKIADCESITRISRRINGSETGTETCILNYDRELALPVTIKLAFLSFKIRNYIPNPMQCKNCYKFGHTAKHCRHTVICSNCSERDHVAEHCKAKVQKCTNCGGKHPAISKICNKYVEIKRILAVADMDKLSYKDAAKKIAVNSKKLTVKTTEITQKRPVQDRQSRPRD